MTRLWNCFPLAEPCGGVTGGSAPKGAKCVFPFVYKGKTYNKCTKVDDDKPWCATEKPYKNQFGYCNCDAGTAVAMVFWVVVVAAFSVLVVMTVVVLCGRAMNPFQRVDASFLQQNNHT